MVGCWPVESACDARLDANGVLEKVVVPGYAWVAVCVCDDRE
jgi:hypothetical protein